MMNVSDAHALARLLRKSNMLERSGESWKPPIFSKRQGTVNDLRAALRRFFDIQAASIWRDLSVLLRQAKGNVLDVGCGAQPYRCLLPSDCRYLGIDHAHASDFGYNVADTTYYSGDVWPVPDSHADVILATETLEHVPSPRAFLQEARRCLKAGGTLILTVPFAARWHFIPHDYWRFTPSGLKMLLCDSGFGTVYVFARGGATSVAAYKAMALILRLLMPQTKNFGPRLASLIVGIIALPALLLLALIAQISLVSEDSDDCLGYTIIASD